MESPASTGQTIGRSWKECSHASGTGGPDGKGLWHSTQHAFGHTRLSIIDLVCGAQPMSHRDEKWHVTFNGEIYNYRELRDQIGTERFRTHSDTEVLLELPASGVVPEDWIPQLDGMFAFALAHGAGLTLVRDPLGIKPLYVGQQSGALVFASELKAMPTSTQDVTEFPPGCYYTTETGLVSYYSVPDATSELVDVWTARAELRRRLEQAVRKRLIADVPVGVFLSGGLDSSLIAALARRHKNPLETFAVCTENGLDRQPAREVADYLGTIHHEWIYTVEDAIEALPEVIYHLESFDCALVRSAIPNFFLAKLARQHVKVALSGEGADELFAGYEYLKAIPMAELAAELQHITSSLHNTNLQRCDRMSMGTRAGSPRAVSGSRSGRGSLPHALGSEAARARAKRRSGYCARSRRNCCPPGSPGESSRSLPLGPGSATNWRNMRSGRSATGSLSVAARSATRSFCTLRKNCCITASSARCTRRSERPELVGRSRSV